MSKMLCLSAQPFLMILTVILEKRSEVRVSTAGADCDYWCLGQWLFSRVSVRAHTSWYFMRPATMKHLSVLHIQGESKDV